MCMYFVRNLMLLMTGCQVFRCFGAWELLQISLNESEPPASRIFTEHCYYLRAQAPEIMYINIYIDI